jgi:hypothetical protein
MNDKCKASFCHPVAKLGEGKRGHAPDNFHLPRVKGHETGFGLALKPQPNHILVSEQSKARMGKIADIQI